MVSCVDELMELDCLDMSVCGNDCTLDDGDPVSEDHAIVLPVGLALVPLFSTYL